MISINHNDKHLKPAVVLHVKVSLGCIASAGVLERILV